MNLEIKKGNDMDIDILKEVDTSTWMITEIKKPWRTFLVSGI